MGRPPFDFGSQLLKARADYHRMATVLISPGRRFGATRCGPGRSHEGMLPRWIHGRRRRTLRPTTFNLSGVLEGLETAQSGPCDCPRNLPFLIRRSGMDMCPLVTEGVSKLEQAPPCRTICTSSGFCTGDFPVYRGLQEIKLLHGAARPRFDTGSTQSGPSHFERITQSGDRQYPN